MALVLPDDVVDTFSGMWTGTITYDAVLTGVAAADALDPAPGRRRAGDHAQVRPGARRTTPTTYTGVLVDDERDRLVTHFGGTADQLARYTALLDSVRAAAPGSSTRRCSRRSAS